LQSERDGRVRCSAWLCLLQRHQTCASQTQPDF
jgi:hypothetical protein